MKMIILHILTGAGLIILIGYISEFLFRKLFIPDVLFLIFVGYILSPDVTGLVNPDKLGLSASIFTTFTLLFLLFVGGLHIDLRSFLRGIRSGSFIAFMNFFISVTIVSSIFAAFGVSALKSIMLGCALGGISSAFVIPVITQLQLHKQDKKLYTVLTLESAITDVFSIIFTLTMLELIVIKAVNPQTIATQIIGQFSVAIIIGISAAALSIFLEGNLFESDRHYMMTIAFLLLTYALTEYLNGNGAIAVLFVGLTLNNPKDIYKMKEAIFPGKRKDASEKEARTIYNAVSNREKLFYNEISFFLKTFFFVYIGLLLNFKNLRSVIIAAIASIGILIARIIGCAIAGKEYPPEKRKLISAIYARGLAPAVLMQIAIEQNIIKKSDVFVDVVYLVIAITILLSSLQIFLYKRNSARPE